MKVNYQATHGEDDVWLDAHDVIHGVPRIGESVHGHLQYQVVDVIWRPQDDTVHVVLKKKGTP